jgi:hypothetical protein
MKRKLISYELFESIQQNALSTAENELVGAESILADVLNIDEVSLVCYGKDNALYESSDGTYVHTAYNLGKKHVNFKNIEQLVLDESTEVDAAKAHVEEMMDAILDSDQAKANEVFSKYLKLPIMKRSFNEAAENLVSKKKKKKKSNPFLDMIKNKKKDKDDEGTKKAKKSLKFKTKTDKLVKIKEWKVLVENVNSYVKFKEFGSLLSESDIVRDEKGNVVGARVPNTQTRNEAKILSFNWKTMDTDVKVLRSGAKMLSENSEFCKSIANLKRLNALSDDKIQESLEEVVGRWPGVLYLTTDELSVLVGESLDAVGVMNYDDNACDYLSEALLRTAHNAYNERVCKVMSLAGASCDCDANDAFEQFSNITKDFYPHLDESSVLEMQVYVDLYEALRGIHSISGSQLLRKEAAAHLNELAAVIEQRIQPNVEVALQAAEWLNSLVETNLDSEEWSVSNSVHTTVNGDNPRMAQNAKKGYTPSSDFSGDWGDSAPVSDGKGYKNGLADEMRNRSWGNLGGEGIYPSLTNPYIPKPFGNYEIKGEKTIDGDSDQLVHQGGSDTWPNLQNPYNPKAETPQTYKMNYGKEQDLVVDR